MPTIFKTGAFVQQCFSSHSLCLRLKKFGLPNKLVLACTACKMLHGLTLRSLTTRAAEQAQARREASCAKGAEESLAACAANHPEALRVRSMDVLSDSIGLRCIDCRRIFDLDVADFETRQK